MKSTPSGGMMYDPLGRLFWAAGTGTWDMVGDEIMSEINGGTNTIRRRYVYGPGGDELLVWYDGAQTTTPWFLHADERGSIVAASNPFGTVLYVNTYDEYGKPAATNGGMFQYTGQFKLWGLGLYDYKNRLYDPALGRFMQTDPIGYGDGMNLYGYVGGDPINLADPSGTDSFCGGPALEKGEYGSCGQRFHNPFEDMNLLLDRLTTHFTGAGDERFLYEQAAEMRGRRGGWGRLVDNLTSIYCSLPSGGFSLAGRGYDVLGGGLVAEVGFDPHSGKLGVSLGFDVGLGFGSAGQWSTGGSGTLGRNIPSGWSGGVGVNANVRVGPLAAGAGRTLIGRQGPGFNGVSAGLRPGGTGATVNANVGARVGYGGKLLPSCGKGR